MNRNKSRLIEFLHGVAEVVEAEDGALRFFRVPQRLLPKLNERVNIRGFSPAGTELRFRMTGTPVRIGLRRMPDGGNSVFNSQTAVLAGIFRGDFQGSWIALQEGDNEIEIAPFTGPIDVLARNRSRFSPELTRIVLPPFIELRLLELEGEIEPARPEDCPGITCLAYGSSITQGAYTPLGTGSYPAVLARELGVDVCNLGFGGGALLEPEIAEWIVSRDDWRFATLELGANLFHLSADEFRLKVRDFLAVFASDSKHRPVFCLDLLPPPGEVSGEAKEKAAAFRETVGEEVNATGATFLFHLEYASSLPRVSDLSTDLLHPAAHAFESIGRTLAGQIGPLLSGMLQKE